MTTSFPIRTIELIIPGPQGPAGPEGPSGGGISDLDGGDAESTALDIDGGDAEE